MPCLPVSGRYTDSLSQRLLRGESIFLQVLGRTKIALRVKGQSQGQMPSKFNHFYRVRHIGADF